MSRVEILKKSASYLTGLKLIKPTCQRMIIKSKIDEIVNYQLDYIKKYKTHNFIGTINIHCLRLTNEYYLLDGQHRFEAIKRLFEKHGHNYNYYTEFIYVDSIEQLKENFSILNKNTPLPEFPFNIDRSIPEKTASHFQHLYPNFWSTTRAYRPKININHFQESLAYLTKVLNIKNEKELIKIMEKKNELTLTPNIISGLKVSDNMLSKAKEYNFFLCLYPHISTSDYGYKWAKVEKKKKVAIPKRVKHDCWEIYIGRKYEDKCPVCKIRPIQNNSFEAGHIKSERDGGSNTVDNLIPICGECNRSMATMNMEVYIKNHYPSNLKSFKNLLNRCNASLKKSAGTREGTSDKV